MNYNKDRIRKAKKYRRELLANPPYYQTMFEDYLKDYKYVKERIMFIDEWKFYIVDFYLPKHRVVIEIDGIQHESSKEYDLYRTKDLKSKGVRKVIRFKNSDLINLDTDTIKGIIKINLMS